MSGVHPPAPHEALGFLFSFALTAPGFPPSTGVAPTTAAFGFGEDAAGEGEGAAALGWAGGGDAFSSLPSNGAAPLAACAAPGDAGVDCAAGSALTDAACLLHPTDALAPRTASAATKVSTVNEGLRIRAS